MMFYIGLMSGTSMDAVDAALLRVVDDRPEVVRYQQTPIEASLRRRLRAMNDQTPLVEYSALEVLVGERFAKAAIDIIDSAELNADDICAIGSHGQTALHLPDADPPRTLQLGDPNIIAYRTSVTTVADFRRMDMAAGGRGAPLASLLHGVLLNKKEGGEHVVLNIGGIANITTIPAEKIHHATGFDSGPGNGLMDAWIQRHLAEEFDTDGQWASDGVCHAELLSLLRDDAYFTMVAPKSTGKDYFNLAWLENKLAMLTDTPSPVAVQATLLELSVITISEAIKQAAPGVRKIFVCGGGVHNRQLMKRLQKRCEGSTITTTEALGILPDAVEAAAFAWLAKCRLEHKAGNIPTVTGANQSVVLGGVYTSSDATQEKPL